MKRRPFNSIPRRTIYQLLSDTIYSGYNNRTWGPCNPRRINCQINARPFEANGGRRDPMYVDLHRKLAISTVSNFRSFELTAELSSSSDGGSIMLGYPRLELEPRGDTYEPQ